MYSTVLSENRRDSLSRHPPRVVRRSPLRHSTHPSYPLRNIALDSQLGSVLSVGVCLSTTAAVKHSRHGRDRSGGCAASWRRPFFIGIPHTVCPSSRGAWYTSRVVAYTSAGRWPSGAEASRGFMCCRLGARRMVPCPASSRFCLPRWRMAGPIFSRGRRGRPRRWRSVLIFGLSHMPNTKADASRRVSCWA